MTLTRTLAPLALAAALSGAAPAAAQTLLDRSPNLSGAWVGNTGTLYFNFLHRFTASDPPVRKVANVPTFTVAAGVMPRLLVGLHYATNSALAPRYPNEWEIWGRYLALSQDRGAPVDLGAQAGWNLAADGVDAELTLARRLGGLRVIAAGRVLADPLVEGETRFAVAGGGTLRLSRYWAVGADVATLVDRQAGEDVAWGAGLHLAIPTTPHSFSLQATNVGSYTLQGMSRGDGIVRYGFEFTVPLTLARWFGPGAAPAPPPPMPAASAPAGEVVRAGIRNFAYTPARIEVDAGTTIQWTNDDQLAHTVTATGGGFDSGLIQPGQSWSHTFDAPGTYDFSCTPHPFMKGTVVVR